MERLKKYVIRLRSACRPSFNSLELMLGSPDDLEMLIDEITLRTSRWCTSLKLKYSSSSSGSSGGGGVSAAAGWSGGPGEGRDSPGGLGLTVLLFGGGLCQ